MKYCESVFRTKRFPTREVMVGNVGVGGNNPVRIQSMTTSSTRDVEATVAQIMQLADVGCEIARVTVQGMKEADACEGIKNGLIKKGYTIPLVADIHFYPPAAMRVVDFVDKVRVNPGNFVDKRASFKTIEYDDKTYALELEKIDEKFSPLIEKCKKLKRSMRIGTNHGSLSDRIMNRYGDTARGMVESALEFTRVARKHDFHDIIFSMKASNPIVMMEAYRLLVAEMYTLGWNYPLHLGVTEAGAGEDGRLKSAMGIGSLLLDGIGDTIRVSLTEDAWKEIDPCKRLVRMAEQYIGTGIDPFEEKFRNIAAIERRPVVIAPKMPLHRDGSAVICASPSDIQRPDFYTAIGCGVELGRPKLKRASADALLVRELPQDQESRDKLRNLQEVGVGIITPHTWAGAITLQTLSEATAALQVQAKAKMFTLPVTQQQSQKIAVVVKDESPAAWKALIDIAPGMIFLAPTKNRLHYSRHFFEWLRQNQVETPVIVNYSYDCDSEDLTIHAGAEYGAILCDGIGDGVCLEAACPIEDLQRMSFNILQAARRRTFKTDFISCPSCGRTLFDLQEVSARIRERTGHLPGVKVAIMGCIVNGPGEMADADFGYVGSKPGMVDLYVGKECVKKDIDFSEADEHLVQLIKDHGRWVEVGSE